MRNETLQDLIDKWERLAEDPQCENGAEDAQIGNAKAAGERIAYSRCAENLSLLINLLA